MAVSGFTKGELVRRQYKVRRKIGEGGFSVVYKAYDQRLKRYVAIKMCDPPPEMCFDYAGGRFRKEARTLAKIRSPHVVTIYNIGQRSGRLYFVMEYLPFSLADLIDDYEGDPIPYEVASHILKQILEGLTAIHTRNWVHRDVKPSNILMTDDNDAKLSDFGLIRTPAGGMTGPNVLIGTPDWMAPEQRLRQPATPKSDVYAFGLVAYQMLTGQSPEDVDEPVEFSICNVNPKFVDLLATCTSKDPSDRPASAEEVLEKWLRIEESIKYKPRPRRVRSDARIGTVMSRIEKEYGLPSGSVFFRYPNKKRPVQRNVTVLKLRQRWEEH